MPTASTNDGHTIEVPRLSPTFCYTPFALRSFLRQSRAITDDPISQQLSAYSQRSARTFQPLASSPPTRLSSASRLPTSTCDSFVSSILLPAWSDRSLVLRYCDDVAAKEDDNDPERLLRVADEQKKHDMIVNERLDPYSGRFEVRESRQEKLRRTIKEELEIESIIRSRSWGVLRTRCQAVTGDWNDVDPIPAVDSDISRQ